jgi:hypothetical protein
MNSTAHWTEQWAAQPVLAAPDKPVCVRAYARKDGTAVRAYTRAGRAQARPGAARLPSRLPEAAALPGDWRQIGQLAKPRGRAHQRGGLRGDSPADSGGNSTRAHQIENILVSEFHNLGHALSHFGLCFRPPFAQPGIQLLSQRIHACGGPRFSFAPNRARDGLGVRQCHLAIHSNGLATTGQGGLSRRAVSFPKEPGSGCRLCMG